MHSRIPGTYVGFIAFAALTGLPIPALAHHSYAMFDGAKTSQVAGTVARIEWRNPHVYVWVYVKNPQAANGYTLYAFENGAINVLERRGWTRDMLHAGDAINVTYWPLKDGRPGGHFEAATLSDGRVVRGSWRPARREWGWASAMKSPHRLNILMLALLAATSMAAEPRLPDWSGWWGYDLPVSEELRRAPAPLLPHRQAEREAAQKRDDRRYCSPQQFTGHINGFVAAVEFLFTPGRVTLTNEGGLIRRIYTDGRSMPSDPTPNYTGTSIGHWEGQTLVVETAGIVPIANYPGGEQGDIPIGRGVHITERFRLVAVDAIEQDVTVVAPETLSRPDRRVRVFRRLRDHDMAKEWTNCVQNDRAIDPVTGRQRFDMTPPDDLPPPPP